MAVDHQAIAAELLEAVRHTKDGVPWPHARIMVRCEGGAGKTSTINALAGKKFDEKERTHNDML